VPAAATEVNEPRGVTVVRANKRWLLLLMSGLVFVGAARGAVALTAQKALVSAAKPRFRAVEQRHVDARLIRRYRARTWRWQELTATRLTRRAASPATPRVLAFWVRTARRARLRALRPPHRKAWLCIHHYEGSWRDSGDPYWGGLQMDRGFMEGYAPRYLLRRGYADRWSPIEQMWVAERAYRSGRGFGAWPNTARTCGVL
jgi:hypothetical protein